MRSITTHLTVVLLLCTLLPGCLIGVTACWYVFNGIREISIKEVRLIADARYESTRKRLFDYNERNQHLLDNVIAVCRHSDGGINACAKEKMEQFIATHQAVGLSLHSGIESDLAVGSDAMPFDKFAQPFKPGQIALIATSKINGASVLSMIATDRELGFSLVATYPGQNLQDIFVGSSVLGASGDTFLADNQGLLITKSRYSSQQGSFNAPLSVAPMQRCLQGESGETLDFNGFRFIPEIGGGCIMAHIDRKEVFSPLIQWVIELVVMIVFFACCAGLIARMIGRRVTKPVTALTGIAQALSQGDFTQRASSTSYAEFNALSEFINDMVGQLGNALSQLKVCEYGLKKKIVARPVERHKRHRKYRSVIHSSLEGFWRVDREGRLLEVNLSYCRCSGYSEAELVGQLVTDLEAQETPEETAEHIRKVMQFGTDSFETRHRRKDGSVWDIEVNVSFIDEDGEYFIVFFQDISKRKRAEQMLQINHFAERDQMGNELQSSRNRYEDLFDFAPIGYLTLTDKGLITEINLTGAKLLGDDRKKILNRYISSFLSPEECTRWRLHNQHTLNHDGKQSNEFTLQRENGTVFYALLDCQRRDSLTLPRVLVSFTDITERKLIEKALVASERDFRSLAENIPDNIVRWDAAGRYLYINPTNERATGASAVDSIGKRLSEAFPDDRFSTLESAIDQVVATEEPMLFVRQLVPTGNGELRIHDINLVPERDSDGRIVSVLGIGRDMTDIYHLQEAIAIREQELRALAESSPGMMGSFHLRLDGSVCMPYVSQNIWELFGLRPQDVVDDAGPLLALNHPDDAQRVSESIAESARTMTPWRSEYRILHPTHGERWMEGHTNPEPHPDGGIVWYGYVHDITERKHVQQRMEQLDYAINMSSDAIFLLDEQFRFNYVNAEACRSLGYSREELLTMTPLDIDPDVTLEQVQEGMKNSLIGSAVKFESRHRTKDGRIFPVELIASHFEDGGVKFSLTVARDITERKRAEADKQRLVDILEQSADYVGSADLQGNLLYHNRAARCMIGLSEDTDLSAMHIENMHPAWATKLLLETGLPAVLEQGIWRGDNALLHRDGREIPVSQLLMLHRDADGKPEFTSTIMQDITERRLLERQLQQAQKMEALGQLTGGIAHDFNNILAAILGYSNLARERCVTDPTDKLARYLGEVISAGERARDLIAKMLAYSRTSSIVASAPLDITEEVKKSIAMLSTAIPAGIDVAIRIEPDLPPVRIDPIDIQHVLVNLAINARDAIGEQGRIDITLERIRIKNKACAICHNIIDGDYVAMEVKDSGRGIPADVEHRIFDPFFTTKDIDKGSGLGLSVVQGIVIKNNAHLLIETGFGQGASFRLLLPFANVADEKATVSAIPISKPVTPITQHRRIWIVEDQEYLAGYNLDLLQEQGYLITVFNDPAEALRNFRLDPGSLDLLLTDQTMPHFSGAKLAGFMLAVKPELRSFLSPVIAKLLMPMKRNAWVFEVF